MCYHILHRSVALVEFLAAADAKRAFKKLAYTRYQHVPLYLEWAPDAVFISSNNNNGNNDNSDSKDISSTTATGAAASTHKTALVRTCNIYSIMYYDSMCVWSSSVDMYW
jgi:hypothetical protein